MAKARKMMGVQQILLSLDAETQALLEYLCQQSGKLYNSGLYFARQLFFKTGKLLTGKFDLAYEPSVSKSILAQSMPSTPIVKRGLYRTANGLIINADLQGAANILKKVARNLSIDLARLGRRCLTTVAFAKRVPCTELDFGFYLNLLCPQNLRL